MGENSLIFENLPEHLYRTGNRVPPISRSRLLDHPLAVRNGGCCLKNTAIGIRFTNALLGGAQAGVFEKLFEYFSRRPRSGISDD